jgi:hypothetical protein
MIFHGKPSQTAPRSIPQIESDERWFRGMVGDRSANRHRCAARETAKLYLDFACEAVARTFISRNS